MSSDNGRTLAIVAYVLHLVGAVSGILSIVALILNYVVRDEHGELMASHHNWMIRTFWITVLAYVACFVLVITIIGIPLAWLLGIGAWIWYIYRHIRGLVDLSSDKPMSATAWV
ncbi:MAG TPA: DUF4870 domain-containing protein [Gammaproteobacteria bacterium]|jgi:uncharacterized membrane protein|nr:DUF4870 domain-containing protein [Gammaproteobacteria bacterium]